MQNIVTILLMQQQQLLIVLALISLILYSPTTAAPRISRIRSAWQTKLERERAVTDCFFSTSSAVLHIHSHIGMSNQGFSQRSFFLMHFGMI